MNPLRPFTAADYPTICDWWKAHSWPAIPLEFLPESGFIIDGVAAGFLYRSDSKIAWLEFIISNPEVDAIIRDKALDTLIETISQAAKSAGYKALFTSSNHSRLIARYEKLGFALTDAGVTHLIRSL